MARCFLSSDSSWVSGSLPQRSPIHPESEISKSSLNSAFIFYDILTFENDAQAPTPIASVPSYVIREKLSIARIGVLPGSIALNQVLANAF